MTKKVLALSSSPRKGGNSDLLCDQFISGANEAGLHTEKIFLNDMDINYCTGCGTCIGKGKACSQNDDMTEILQKMIDADVIVMATPVYFYTMNARMKTLIDRCCARYTEIKNKDFYFIMVAADTDKSAVEQAIAGFRSFTYCLNGAKEKAVLYGTGAWKAGDIKRKPAMKEAFALGKSA